MREILDPQNLRIMSSFTITRRFSAVQINSIRQLAIPSLSRSSAINISNPIPALKGQFDSVSISDVAQRLNAKLQKSSAIEKAELTDSLPPIGKKIDQFMKRAADILMIIKDLTDLAQDESLGADSHVEIQIEIEDLRDNLQILPRNLMTDENRASYIQLFEESDDSFRALASGDRSGFGESTSILDRIRTRIRSGQEWNVREAWTQ